MANSSKIPLTLTRNNGKLSLGQRIFYEKNGFILIPRLVSFDLLERCNQRFEDIVSGKVSTRMMTVMKDIKDRKSVFKIQDFNNDEILKEYLEHNDILDVVESFIGPNIMAMHSMLIAKPPDIGFGSSRHPPHQDLYYFPFRPADKIVASWTAMEPCTVENGCLYVLPGSHKKYSLFPHEYPSGSVNKMFYGIQKFDDSTDWIYLEMETGDTVFFHPLLVHGSGVNKSKGTRKAISGHFAAAECDYIDVKGTMQDKLRKEIFEAAKRKFGEIDIDLIDIWRIKSSLVRGIRSNL